MQCVFRFRLTQTLGSDSDPPVFCPPHDVRGAGSLSLDNIAKLLQGPVGSTCDLSVERDIENFTLYSSSLTSRSQGWSVSDGPTASGAFVRRKAQLVVKIERTHPSSQPEKRSRVVNLIHF